VQEIPGRKVFLNACGWVVLLGIYAQSSFLADVSAIVKWVIAVHASYVKDIPG